MRYEIIDHGTSEAVVRRDLLQFGRNLADLHDGFEDVGEIMRDAVREQFLSEGARGGSKWPELAESTKANRARAKGLTVRGGALRDRAGRFASAGHPILRVTDALFDSLTRKFDPEHVESASAESLRFGTTVPYAKFHQSNEPRTRLPRRAPVALTEGDKRAITKALQRATLKGVRAARGPVE